MGKLDEYREIECFREAEKNLVNLARFAKHDTVRKGWYNYNRLYRILGTPIEELDRWEKDGGYDPEKSMWDRYPCTSNRYLACMVKMELNPPWLRKPEVVIEVQELYPKCIRYSDATVGNVPTLRGQRRDDVYVNQEDLPLFECWIERKVGIDEIKKIYLDEEADEKVKARVKDFAEQHKIPVENRIPCPSDDDKVMREYDRPKDWGVTDKGLKKLVGFLKERSKVCWLGTTIDRVPSDSVVAGLAESLDEALDASYWPLGASDAISKRNERLRERPPWGRLAPEPECDGVICKTTSLEGMKRELNERYQRLRREGK